MKRPVKERDVKDRVDATYPVRKVDENGWVKETLTEPVIYDIKFLYHQKWDWVGSTPYLVIKAQRLGKAWEQYVIEIKGDENIKSVM
jgi:hypothetical protein